MNILITDINNFKFISKNEYDKLILVGYSSDSLTELKKIKSKNNNIDIINPSSNYDKAYKIINKRIAEITNKNTDLIAIYKLNKKELFNLGLILLAYEQNKNSNNIEFYTTYNQILKLFDQNLILKNIKYSIKIKNYFKLYKNIFIYFLYLSKAFYLLFNSLIKEKKQSKTLFIDYYNKRVLGHIEISNNDIFLEHSKTIQQINLKNFIFFIKYQLHILKLIKLNIFLINNLYIYANNMLYYLSLITSYNPKNIIGSFDVAPHADIGYIISKFYKIKFICYAHSFNYNFKTEYIYNPFDLYFVWSKKHLEHIKKGTYIDNPNCKFIIAGCPFYLDWNKKQLTPYENKKIDILVIGEYYYDEYYIQPFNSFSTIKLAKALNELSNNYKIMIRGRFNDGYIADMKSILKDKVTYSIPESQNDISNSIFNDLNRSKLVISMTSGGIHDALLLKIPVIQANFLGIEPPKNFKKDNLVYYCTKETCLIEKVNLYFENKLDNLNFEFHKKEYLDDGKINSQVILKEL